MMSLALAVVNAGEVILEAEALPTEPVLVSRTEAAAAPLM